MRDEASERSTALLLETLRALEDAGVAHCLLRPPAPGPERGSPREADILVAARDLERLGRVVATMGFVAIASRGHGSHRFYEREDGASGARLKLDLVTSLRYGGRGGVLGTRALDGALARRRRESAIHVLDPADAFLGLLLHCVLDKKAFREDHRRELARLAEQLDADDPARARAEERFRSALGASMTFHDAGGAVRNGRWDSLLARRLRIAWELARREPWGSIARWTQSKLSRAVHRFRVARSISG